MNRSVGSSFSISHWSFSIVQFSFPIDCFTPESEVQRRYLVLGANEK